MTVAGFPTPALSRSGRVGGEYASRWVINVSSLGRGYGSRTSTRMPPRQTAFVVSSKTKVVSGEKMKEPAVERGVLLVLYWILA